MNDRELDAVLGEPQSAFDAAGLPDLRWWRRAVEREFEGAGEAHLYTESYFLVGGYVEFPGGLRFNMPMMGYANEPATYGRYWRETVGRVLREELPMWPAPIAR